MCFDRLKASFLSCCYTCVLWHFFTCLFCGKSFLNMILTTVPFGLLTNWSLSVTFFVDVVDQQHNLISFLRAKTKQEKAISLREW